MPDKKKEKINIEEEKQQKPSEELLNKKLEKIVEPKKKPISEETKIKQVSEYEKKELFDPNSIAALIDKSK